MSALKGSLTYTRLFVDGDLPKDFRDTFPKSIRLRAMKPLDPARVVRGQFRGYRDEAGVAKDSTVETFAAMCLHIDTWRWAGVPFYIRTGKCMPVTATEVMVDLKRPPVATFDEITPAASNYFRFRLSPEVVISAGARVKRAGEAMEGDGVELVARHAPGSKRAPYERLLHDAIRDDATLFIRDDSVEAAWRIVDPVLGAGAPPVAAYEPGTWGPSQAARVFEGVEGWHDPKPSDPAPA
jgi:glucose-6-phosphate 1-dehydrogenase